MLTGGPPRRALDFGEPPDRALGIYETMLVRDGKLPALARHMERLRTSAQALYGIELDAGLERRLRERAAGHDGRLRLTLTATGEITIETGPIPPPPGPALIAYVLPGGLGPHKWADRRLLEALELDGAGALPLLVDEDGSVLESSRTGVAIEEAGRLTAPPADGRILPSTGLCDQTAVARASFDLDRLLAADAVVLVSALRVVRLASSYGGRPSAEVIREQRGRHAEPR